ncbi:hypothetical protein E4U43_003326 [Claviceps pusilla]|uniref:Uncharacterized protein n=1 Tax=Claviceps pusilla TaxID=123648 RepID=A0A9P7N7J1_9HYPO|nr:hypothetical protein E4U43_003326 [Claviceps pusilla]
MSKGPLKPGWTYQKYRQPRGASEPMRERRDAAYDTAEDRDVTQTKQKKNGDGGRTAGRAGRTVEEN